MASDSRLISSGASARGGNGSRHGAAGSSLRATAGATGATALPGGQGQTLGTTSLRVRLFAFDFLASSAAWFVLGLFFFRDEGKHLERLTCSGVGMLVTLLSLSAGGLYRSRVCSKLTQELRRVVLACLLGAGAFVATALPTHWSTLRDGVVCGSVCMALTVLLRIHYRRWITARRSQGAYLRNVILVGGNDDSTALWTMLNSEPELGYRVAGVIDTGSDPRPWDHLPGSGSIADLASLASDTAATGVVIASNALTGKDLQWVISVACAYRLHVQVWPGLMGVGSARLREAPIAGESFFYIEPQRTQHWQRWTKRGIDIVGSLIGLVLSLPLLLLASAAIKLERSGPVLHRQSRVGLDGEVFTIYKLRTMVVGSEDNVDELQALNQRTDGPLYKSKNDPRVTRAGRLCRPLSIDELPQLWNVFRGSMSLVGPRPALPHEAAQFDNDLQRRHNMRPGITGLWQARARENPSFNAYRRLDLHYIDNWSLRLDLTILLATIPTVVGQAIQALTRPYTRPGVRRAEVPALNAIAPRAGNFPNIGDEPTAPLGDNPMKRELDPA